MFNYLVTKLRVNNVIVRYILLFIDTDTFYDKWCDKLIGKKQKQKQTRFKKHCVQEMLLIPDTKFPTVVKTTYDNCFNENSSEDLDVDIREEDDFLPVANERMDENKDNEWRGNFDEFLSYLDE